MNIIVQKVLPPFARIRYSQDLTSESYVRDALPGRTTRKLLTKAKVTRSALLEAAHEIFRKRGYYASSVSEISRHLGLSAGTFYQYFKNKEQVFLELNDLILARFAAEAEAVSSMGESFPERLPPRHGTRPSGT